MSASSQKQDKFVYFVHGYSGCGYFDNACRCVQTAAARDERVSLKRVESSRPEFKKWLRDNNDAVGSHRTSPACFENEQTKEHFIGGCDDLCAHVNKKFPAQNGSSVNQGESCLLL